MPSCLIIASHFPPMQSAGVFRTIRIAKYLPEHGWSLDVLTVQPRDYIAGTSTSVQLLDQIPDSVRVHRTMAKHPNQWVVAVKDRLRRRRPRAVSQATAAGLATPRPAGGSDGQRPPGLLQRAKDAVTLPLMTPDRWVGWLPFATRAGKRILRHQRADVLYSSGPPWTNHLVAERLKRASGTPWVADFRDPWVGNHFRPQRLGDSWSGRRHRALERRVMQSADVLIFNTTRARDEAISRYAELPEDKFRVIPNGFDPADFPSAGAGAAGSHASRSPDLAPAGAVASARPLRIVHTGAFYGKRNIDSLLHALGDLVAEGLLATTDLTVELIGAARGGRSREQEIIEARNLGDLVKVLPPIPHEACLRELVAADVLLLVQTEAPLCVPGKLYEYIAVGAPVLTLTADGATADVVTQERLGPCVDPAEPAQIKAALCRLVQQHQQGGLQRPDAVAAERYNGRVQMHAFDGALRAAIGAKSAKRIAT